MRHPCTIESGGAFTLLVLAHLRQRARVHLRVAPAWNESRHTADRVRAALVAHLHESLRVRAHERNRHRQLRPIRQHFVRPLAERLDEAEEIVPAAGIEAGGVLAQLVQDLLHLERRRQRLDEYRRADRAAGDAEHFLCDDEHLVPEPRFTMALELRQVEIRPTPTREQLAGIVMEVEAEVEERRGGRRAIDLHVAFDEVPATGAHQQRRERFSEAVRLALLVERQRSPHRIHEVALPLDHVRPGGRAGVFEIRHEDARAGVQRVDHHLPIHRSRDLHAAIVQIGRRGRHAPCRGPHGRRVGGKVE